MFISSGGTGATAIGASGITINTSATSPGAGNKAGNIILLSVAGVSGPNPGNINVIGSTFSQNGGTSGTLFNYGLAGAAATVPTVLNVTPTAAINIRPGGYQVVSGSSGSPLAVAINTGGDTQIVVPINVGASDSSGYSLYLSMLTQASNNNNGLDSVALFSSGSISASASIAPNPGTSYFVAITPAMLSTSAPVSISAKQINIASFGGVTVAAGKSVFMSADSNLALWGDLSMPATGNGAGIFLQSANNLIAQGISTAGSSGPGSVTLAAGGSVTARDISTASSTGGDVSVNSASSYVALGSITASKVEQYGGNVVLAAGSYVSSGDIYTSRASVSIVGGSAISGGNISAVGPYQSGNITVSSGGAISLLTLDTSSSNSSGEPSNIERSFEHFCR